MRDDDKELNERGVGSSVLISTMVKHIGVKIVGAAPMNLGDYNKFRGWDIPDDENPATEGYLVQYPGDGYISWCPKDKFEEANQVMTGLTFGYAIESAKKGCKIARAGWNGKGMFVVYMPGYPEGIVPNEVTRKQFGYTDVGMEPIHKVKPYLVLRTADGSHQMWQPSVSDCLERDWAVVE